MKTYRGVKVQFHFNLGTGWSQSEKSTTLIGKMYYTTILLQNPQ